MTKSEPPVQIPRPPFARQPQSAHDLAGTYDEPDLRPRYVQLHALRAHGHGRSNLAWGVALLVLALALLGLALFLAGAKALLALGVCLVTCVALFVLARLHVLRQRNGGFFALGIVCLLSAAIPLVEIGSTALADFVKNRPAPRPALMAAPASEVPPLLLTAAFALGAPDPKAGPRVKVLQDSRVTIEGKPFLIKAGDTFPLGSKGAGEVTLVVRDLLVALPAEALEVLGETPSPPPPPAPIAAVETKAPDAKASAPATPEDALTGHETPAQLTARAQREAIRRYPALGMKDSLENQMFVSTFREIRDAGGDDFFQNPEWPTELAELLAKREKWERGAGPLTVSSGPSSADAAAEDAATKSEASDAAEKELLPEP